MKLLKKNYANMCVLRNVYSHPVLLKCSCSLLAILMVRVTLNHIKVFKVVISSYVFFIQWI